MEESLAVVGEVIFSGIQQSFTKQTCQVLTRISKINRSWSPGISSLINKKDKIRNYWFYFLQKLEDGLLSMKRLWETGDLCQKAICYKSWRR